MKLLKRVFQYKRMYLLLGLPIGLALTLAAKYFPAWVESFYMPYVHTPLERVVGGLVSLLPFSLTEWLLVAAALGVGVYVGFAVYWCLKKEERVRRILYRAAVNAACAGSLIYFLFVITMGLCYYRASATEYLDLKVKEYTVEELAEVTEWLAEQTNKTRENLPEDKAGVSLLQGSFSENALEAQRCFNKLEEKYPGIGKTSARSKPMVFSGLMSRVMTMGVYMPLTLESNINTELTPYTMPATMCHELAHVKGFMQEDEAGFLGFVACMQSEREDFRYSGYMSAFTYALNRLAVEDYAAAVKVANLVSQKVATDDNADAAYWKQFAGRPAAQAGQAIYNTYLENNNHPDGTKSYGKMLDLVIAYYQKEVRA